MDNQDLRSIRMEKGLLQNEVARLSNISPGFYCHIENGNRKPSLEKAKQISYILGLSLDEFYKAININEYKKSLRRKKR